MCRLAHLTVIAVMCLIFAAKTALAEASSIEGLPTKVAAHVAEVRTHSAELRIFLGAPYNDLQKWGPHFRLELPTGQLVSDSFRPSEQRDYFRFAWDENTIALLSGVSTTNQDGIDVQLVITVFPYFQGGTTERAVIPLRLKWPSGPINLSEKVALTNYFSSTGDSNSLSVYSTAHLPKTASEHLAFRAYRIDRSFAGRALQPRFGCTGMPNEESLKDFYKITVVDEGLISAEQFAQVERDSKSGRAEFKTTLSISNSIVDDCDDDHVDPALHYVLVGERHDQIILKSATRKPLYKVAIVQLATGPIDFDKLRLCTGIYENTTAPATLSSRVYPITYVGEKCLFQDRDGSVLIRKIDLPLGGTIFSKKEHTTVKDIPNSDGVFGDLKIYSIFGVQQYWNRMLRKHGVSTTWRGQEPQFEFTVLPLKVISEPSLGEQWSDAGAIIEAQEYIERVTSDLDLRSYDHVVKVVYAQPAYQDNLRFRSHASFETGNSWISTDFGQEIINNNFTMTLAHEFGHQALGLQDLYIENPEGLGTIKFPEGAPDPSAVAQSSGCIMAGWGFGKRFENPNAMRSLLPEDPEYRSIIKRDPFAIQELDHLHLCVDDISHLSDRHAASSSANPNCSVDDFYASRCGECASKNYMTCVRCDTGNDPRCHLKNRKFTVFGVLEAKGIRARTLKKSVRLSVRRNGALAKLVEIRVARKQFRMKLKPGNYEISVDESGYRTVKPLKISVVDQNIVGAKIKLVQNN